VVFGSKVVILILTLNVKLLVIAIIIFKRYPSTNCLMQGSCVIRSNFKKKRKNVYLKIMS